MREILQEIGRLGSKGEPAALASILSASGSLPMSRRSKMLILSDGTQKGTVGGGCLEAEVHTIGRRAIRSGEAFLSRFTLTESEAGAEGLNCGGTVRMLVEPVCKGDDGRETSLYRFALEAVEKRQEAVLITALQRPSTDGAVKVLGKGLVAWKGLVDGYGFFSDERDGPVGLAVEEALAILGQDKAILIEPPPGRDGSPLLFLETVNLPPTLYLFGGGHVSLAIASVARAAGFRIVVIDDRPEFANPARFPDAEETLVRPMESALEGLSIDRSSCIVAVTRGHRHDEPVIEQAILTDAGYIGMIGSRRKVAIMWKRLKERGATERQLSRVNAPVGLDIGADSPGEIAVSIVAQLIEQRRRGTTHPDR